MVTFRKCLAALAITVLCAGPALADPTEDATNGFNAESKGDFATALRLYRLSALAGNPYGEGNLANMLRAGRGTPKDLADALRWYNKAAEQNYPDSEYNLGNMYELGEGVKQDFTKAADWYRKAAEQGYVPAESALGTLYAAGTGVAADRVQAYFWYTLAANGKDENAKRRMTVLAQRITPEQKAKAEQMVKDFKPKEMTKKKE
jgi:TPR repeat protein